MPSDPNQLKFINCKKSRIWMPTAVWTDVSLSRVHQDLHPVWIETANLCWLIVLFENDVEKSSSKSEPNRRHKLCWLIVRHENCASTLKYCATSQKCVSKSVWLNLSVTKVAKSPKGLRSCQSQQIHNQSGRLARKVRSHPDISVIQSHPNKSLSLCPNYTVFNQSLNHHTQMLKCIG